MLRLLLVACLLSARAPAAAFSAEREERLSDAGGFRNLSKGLGLWIGAATPLNLLQQGNTQYVTTLAANYDLITAENECKWSATEGYGRGKFNFTKCDGVRDFAKRHGMVFRGHNLCWGKYNPRWLTQLSEEDARQALTDHVTSVVKHYPDAPFWDVVNEAIADESEDSIFFETNEFSRNETHRDRRSVEEIDEISNPFGFKTSDWYPKVKDFVWVAFRAARKAAPEGTKLFYNDYSINSAYYKKSQRVFALVKNLTQEGLIDGVGLQFHISAGWEKWGGNPFGLKETFKQYENLNLTVHITEMDVQRKGTYLDDEDAQADTYKSVLSECLSAPNCKNFETWGFEDGHTWLGSNAHPLPFDCNFRRKKAANEIARMLAGWPRKV